MKLSNSRASMTYREWYQKYVEGNTEALAEEKAIKNHASDKKQYENYKKILGKDIPDSFVKFQKMKYNPAFDSLGKVKSLQFLET